MVRQAVPMQPMEVNSKKQILTCMVRFWRTMLEQVDGQGRL